MNDTLELAKGYTFVSDTQYNAGLYLLQNLAITPDSRVLDIGCGPGNLTAHIASLVGEKGTVIGIDPSRERIALALESFKNETNLSFHEGVAEDLKAFDDQSFDFVLMNSTFHWVSDQAGALVECARVLKPGGKLGISGGSGDHVAAHERIKAEVLSRDPYSSFPEQSGPKFLKRCELEALLDNAGFSRREISVNKIVKEAKDAEEMIEWLDTSSSGKTYGGIPLSMRAMAKEEMKREWDMITTEEGIKMDMELLVTVAVKG
ncbi:hypothetical protein NHQ30_003988 [Ciborinia camelliae]|nr:hypothetical protein NHQ30_003988 [Ciborinia camelliae]